MTKGRLIVPRAAIRWATLATVVATTTTLTLPTFAQQNVFSRSDSGTNLWENNSALPWYYQTWNNNQSRPNFGALNDVFFGHNANLTQDINTGNWYALRSLTIQPSASSNRVFNSTGGAGISLTSGLTNQSNGEMTFNVQFALEASNVTFLNSGSGLVSASQNIFLNANTLAFDGTGDFSISGTMQGSGSVTKNGNGLLTLTGTNTYAGTTTINGGGFVLGAGGASGAIGTGNVTVNVNGTLQLNRSDTVSLTNVIQGAGGFTKSAAGTATLNSSNSYTGVTRILNGVLVATKLADGGVNSTIGAASASADRIRFDGGTLRYIGTGDSSDRLFSVGAAGGIIEASGTGPLALTNTGSIGTTALGVNLPRTITLGGTGSGSLAPVIPDNGTGTSSLLKTGSGTWSLTGQNTYSGGTTVNNGTLTLGHASNTLADGGAVTVSGGTLALGSNSDTVGAVTLTSGSITGTGTLSGSSYAVSSGSVSAKLGGSGSLTKSTGATVTLSGANTYTGNTTVAAGTLSLATTGSIDNSPVIDVQSGATLDVSSVASYSVKVGQTLKGNGTVVGSTTVNGTLAPGASAGKLTLSGGNLVLASSATTEMEISGTTRGTVGGYDAVDVGGALVYDGALSIPVSGTYVDGTSFNLFDFASQSDNFDSITLSGSYAGALTYGGAGTWSNTISGMVFTFTNSTGVLSLSAQAIPEPLTAAGVILLGSRVLGRRSRASL